jgi:hypothetical protein
MKKQKPTNMKTIKLNITGILLLFAHVLVAQDAIDTYFQKYVDNPNFTSVVVSSKMFELFADTQGNEAESKELKEAIRSLKGIRVLAYDAEEADQKINTNYKDAISKMGEEYEVLMSIDESDERVRFYIREDGDIIKELFMIVGGPNELVLMSLVGNIDLEKISSLSKNLNIGGMNYLDKLNKDE